MIKPGLAGAALATILALAGSGAAQPNPGDFVVGDGHRIGLVDRTSGRTTTLAVVSQGGTFSAMAMSADNKSIWAILLQGHPTLRYEWLSIAPGSGARTTLTTLSAPPPFAPMHGLPVDQDGSVVVGVSAHLLRLSGTVKTLAKVAPPLYFVAAVAIDADNRDDLVNTIDWTLSRNTLLRVDRRTLTVTTLVTIPGQPTETFQHDARTGHFWTTAGLVRLNTHAVLLDARSLAVVTAFRAPDARAIAVDPETGSLFVTNDGYVTHYSRSGVVLRTWYVPGFLELTRIAVLHGRELSGRGSVTPASSYSVQLSFPSSPSAPYCAALSFSGLRPGIQVGSVTIPIRPDPLFFLTACRSLPGLTSRFAGRLDAAGSATAGFWIPSSIPRGTVITFAAIALNPTRAEGIDAAGALTLMVQ
jgi:hypothetical protein